MATFLSHLGSVHAPSMTSLVEMTILAGMKRLAGITIDYPTLLKGFGVTAFVFSTFLQASPATRTTEATKKLTTLLKDYAACWHYNDVNCLMALHVRTTPVLLTGPRAHDRATTLKDAETLYAKWLKQLNTGQPVGVTVTNPTFFPGPDNDSGVATADLTLKGPSDEHSPLSLKGPLRVQLYAENQHGLWLIRVASLSLPLSSEKHCPSCPRAKPSTPKAAAQKTTTTTQTEDTKTPQGNNPAASKAPVK